MPEDKEVLEEQRKPQPFSFDPRDWPAYKYEIQLYFEISKVKLSSMDTKKKTFLYIMGAGRAHEVMETFREKVKDSTTLQELIDLFDNYFRPKRNEVLERGILWDRDQKKRESPTINTLPCCLV